EFTGTYYDRYNDKHELKACIRPYYLVFIASPVQMQQLLSVPDIATVKGNVKEKLLLEPADKNRLPDWKIIAGTPRIGTFIPDPKDSKHTITEAESAESGNYAGQFGISVLANFKKMYRSENYLNDKNNYVAKGGSWQIMSIKPITDKQNATTSGFTHEVKLQTKQLRDETLTLSVLEKVPAWVNLYSSTNDTGIRAGTAETQKTFGLAALVEGLFDAYRLYADPNSSTPGQFERCRFVIHIKT
ncbi:MAG: hypothetical protein ACRC3B_10825, partial [Bacteroidia bacterium]